MKKYYIIRSDGSSLFEQGYDKDFIFHCLTKLLDRSDECFRLLEFDENCKFCAVQATKPYTRRVYLPVEV